MQRPAELSVFKGKDARNGGACLRKQKSLTNLTLLSEGEKGRYSCRENWFGNASRSSQVHHSREREPGSRGLLSKALSKSAHSLYYASNKSTSEMEELPPVGNRKPSKRLKGYPTEESGPGERSKLGGANAPFQLNFTSQKWVEEEEGCLREGTAQLDEDVIITMLGDLEQVLYSDFLAVAIYFHIRASDCNIRTQLITKRKGAWGAPEFERYDDNPVFGMRIHIDQESFGSLEERLKDKYRKYSSLVSVLLDSTLETTFDSTVTTEVNGRSIPGLTSRSSPVTWRLGQASPRLQAGDAPSLGAGYPRSGASRFIHTDPSRFMYTTPLRRAAVSRLGNMPQIDMSEKGNSDLEISSDVDVGGYMSDGDILGKSLRADDINSGVGYQQQDFLYNARYF
ncbi:hypothetical protein JD844_028028 [Phrynosoma platyrhinos]|uniref:Uncharacterized protein n=1 Tax=Phrynosoma platyrhinos TaxID=52577 RepID=A0ABQ7SHB3_PHRPL|nr:hypothetical protein JD844_028028 [Phrynosoma platyrhinos]